jgi:phytanoyl-CoA hydroxylase
VRNFANDEDVSIIRKVAEDALCPVIGPAELEVEVQYPGSPESLQQEGGRTPRRLLHAVARSSFLREWATQPRLGHYLGQLLHTEQVMLSQSHHNCVMTKYPRYSSETLWHQDIRYWSFARPELISFWLALGVETPQNGSLRLIPGSHALTYQPHQMDALKFLRTDLPDNQPLLQRAVDVELAPGDLLLFHARLFHAAGSNQTQDVKLSLVFTAHAAENGAVQGTRSDRLPSLPFR